MSCASCKKDRETTIGSNLPSGSSLKDMVSVEQKDRNNSRDSYMGLEDFYDLERLLFRHLFLKEMEKKLLIGRENG